MKKQFFCNAKAIAVSVCMVLLTALAACDSENSLKTVVAQFNKQLPFSSQGLELKDIAIEDTMVVFNSVFDESDVTVPEFQGAEDVMKYSLFSILQEAGMEPFIEYCVKTRTPITVSMTGNKTKAESRALFSIEQLSLLVKKTKQSSAEGGSNADGEQAIPADSTAQAAADSTAQQPETAPEVKK